MDIMHLFSVPVVLAGAILFNFALAFGLSKKAHAALFYSVIVGFLLWMVQTFVFNWIGFLRNIAYLANSWLEGLPVVALIALFAGAVAISLLPRHFWVGFFKIAGLVGFVAGAVWLFWPYLPF